MTDVLGSLYRGEWQPDKDIIAEIERLRAECDMHNAACALLEKEVDRLTRERDNELAQRLAWEARAESAEKKIAAASRLLVHHFVVAEAGEHEITDEVGISIRLLQQIEGVFMGTEAKE